MISMDGRSNQYRIFDSGIEEEEEEGTSGRMQHRIFGEGTDGRSHGGIFDSGIDEEGSTEDVVDEIDEEDEDEEEEELEEEDIE
jgi:hypothetical protein